MEVLSQLFGGDARAKLVRLFVFNPGLSFTSSDLKVRTLVLPRKIRSIASELCRIGLIRKKKGREPSYGLEPQFPYAAPLANLFATVSLAADERLAARFGGIGKVRLLIASGAFAGYPDGRLDLLIVGDDFNENRVEKAVKALEIDTGREISYSALTTADFHYRLGVYDRLIRDVIDFPYIILIDKIGFKLRK
jgi:hypothetical protein